MTKLLIASEGRVLSVGEFKAIKPEPTENPPATVLGYPVVVDEDLSDPGPIEIGAYRYVDSKPSPIACPLELPMTAEETAYYDAHAVCPQCGNPSYNMQVTSSAGMSTGGWPTDHNKCWCRCGWRGTVHDLVPRKATP